MICSSPHAEKEDMLTKRQKIDEVSENNGGAKSVQVFRSRVESYEDDDEDENEPLVIKRTTEAFRQKTNHGNSLKSRKEITSLTDSAPKVGSYSGIPMLAKNKHKASHSKEAKVLSSDRLSTKETERSPVIPGISTPSANKHLPSRPSISEQVSSGLRPAISRDNLRAEDSDDDMPLSYRQSQSKAAPETVHHHIRNGLSLARDHPSTVRVNSSPNCQRSFQSSDDSDDDRPLSQRLLKKLPTEAETRRPLLDGHGSHDDKKPLGARKLANEPFATTTPAKPSMKDNAVSKKRAVDERVVQSVGHSSKKLKETVNPIKSVAKIEEVDDEDDIPLAQRFSASGAVKLAKKMDDSDEDDIPLVQRFSAVTNQKAVVIKKPAVASKTTIAVKKVLEARKAKFKTDKKDKLKHKKDGKLFKTAPGAGGGQKWTTLEHNGVIFPPPYKPHGIKMLYEGKPVDLSLEQEEVATMFAVMRDTDYATKPKFLANFWNDWKKILRPGHVIKSLEKCDFTPIYQWHLAEKEKKKQMSTEEKKILKEEKLKQEEKYMWALVDGVKEKVGNFRVEPPGLFRGRGEHPKMGKLKRRIVPEDITINIGKGAPIPDCPIPGHRWKEVRHDNTVTWLAFWNDPINVKEFKYVFLAASSSLKGQSDKEKYEKARKLKDYIGDIRKTYTKNFMSSDETTRQIAVATYLIDRLALRAGNEKDDDEADTVGCCSLKVEHVTLIPPRSLEFDFLGKDSIRYNNIVEVEAPVYKAIGDFKKSKKEGQDLFDKLDTTKLNAHLKEIMPGLTAKVFRTYNASITLDNLLVDTNGNIVPEKIASYNTANKEVAVLCNHQRSVSKAHGAQMEKLEGKMAELEALLEELKVDLKRAKKGKPPLKDADGKTKRNQTPEALQKRIMQTNQKIEKMKLDMRLKDDLKTVALGTSKINYMDPRITVAWCKRHEVPIEKIFNKSLLAKFAWAMDVEMEFRF